MIIEDLIRTGKYLREGGIDAEKLLLLISDVSSPQVRNFFQHVFVVELPATKDGEPKAIAKQVWGQEYQPDPKKKATVFEPDLTKAVTAPFVFPGGNPIHPQGVYGVPVFPTFEKHIAGIVDDVKFAENFLQGRLERCPSLSLNESMVAKIAIALRAEVVRDNPLDSSKALCLVILADATAGTSPYGYTDVETKETVGRSLLRPGQFIAPNFERILSLYSSSKVEEGRQSGTREGSCSICGGTEESGVVSIYCKSWPWFLPTWTCPVSNSGKGEIVEGIALDHACYEALNIGASYFDKVTKPVDSIVTRELFSPIADREGRRTAEHKSIADLTTIYGAMLLLPLLEAEQITDGEREEFGENLQTRLQKNQSGGHIKQVVGFEATIPDNVDDSSYRLTLVYYSGDPSRGDIHLRCVIEDVVPTVMYELLKLAQATAQKIPDLCSNVMPGSSEKQHAWHASRFQFVPFMLARAYGGAYVWDLMQSILRRQPMKLDRPTANTAHRIASLTANLPKTEYDIREEVLFYLALLDFVQTYNTTIAEGEVQPMAMRNWKTLLEVVSESPPDGMDFHSVNELGFACGAIVRQFSRQYWLATKVGNEGKDYLKHRILAFGSDLSPDAVWKKALPTIFNVELKLEKLHLADDFKRRIGVLLNRCEDAQEEIRTNRDGFMAAFWSGYSLQKTDKSKLTQQPEEQGATV